MEVEVGLHQASPPLSNCGYSPAWISCEYAGTFNSRPSAPPSGLGAYGLALGISEATAPRASTVGAALLPGVLYSVTRKRHAVKGWSLAKKVSMATKPSASPCPPTEVRWISASLKAQRPITNHLVVYTLSGEACISIWIQVPGGVAAFHDDTSSLKLIPLLNHGEVQRA